ncbi:hypothetical protein E1B28_010585 [Marasmius oreades]|uniref:Uncharacterized protein n=1 Tax=Marasmius oreades TaxID=181124 RepID=A0A9P7RXL5_9AGAR|nr:uncharacterized protein E1B28_010585 [Marasmius oreades]KAG7091557.1 hypothetical protein E1B28_010585 [Marasmius oreades]
MTDARLFPRAALSLAPSSTSDIWVKLDSTATSAYHVNRKTAVVTGVIGFRCILAANLTGLWFWLKSRVVQDQG